MTMKHLPYFETEKEKKKKVRLKEKRLKQIIDIDEFIYNAKHSPVDIKEAYRE
jgi:hypothetical protein